jgi:2-amino-4-hydroxy-6-hydroxymethyldihydropteridine diphosphokinase
VDHIRRVVVGLGSNLGDRLANIEKAVERLRAEEDIHVLDVSPLYETTPVGGPPQSDFINGAALLVTAIDAVEIMERLLRIEKDLGRERGEKNGPRTIDLDILWIEGESLSTESLVVPHPRLAERAFALRPLIDLAPDARHSETGLVFAELPLALTELRLAKP